MARELLHRFEEGGKRFAIDPETCFCFECDEISWDVLAHYPQASVSRIYHELGQKHDVKELAEVIGELEWLRATKSILSPPTADKFVKQFEVVRGVNRLSVRLPRGPVSPLVRKRGWFSKPVVRITNEPRILGQAAVGLLLGRCGAQQVLVLQFLEQGFVSNPEGIAELAAQAFHMAALADKKLTVIVRVMPIELSETPPLAGHTPGLRLEFRDASAMTERLGPFARTGASSLARLAKSLQPADEAFRGGIVVQPNHPDYAGAAPALHRAGFGLIELDLDGAFLAHPEMNPREMLAGLRPTAFYYAESLLQGRHFRLDPIADLFYRIHEGSPLRRADPAGTNELAIDEDGLIYPSWRMLGWDAFRAGSAREGAIEETLLKRFEDVGAQTTGPCRRCWARHLCGGGAVALHQNWTNSIRTPHEPWCEAQRAWMASAVAAFNVLAAHGVNFTRVYQALGGTAKPSLWTMARAALQLTIRVRPIEEADAEMLVKWENWSEASYFVCNPAGLFLATVYNREMDALHPQTLAQELILERRDGAPCGLLRIAPDGVEGVAHVAVFLRNPADYASEEVRKGFRALLKESARHQKLRRILTPAGDHEPALRQFLEAIGFSKAGTQREALFLHGRFHDVHLYVLDTQ